MKQQNPNPTGNSIIQALLDLQKRGYGACKLDDLLVQLGNDRKELTKLQAVWDGHAYPDKSLRFTKQAINDGLFQLSAPALMVLTFLGMHADRDGHIQVKQKDLAHYLGYKDRHMKTLFKELLDCGAIKVLIPSKAHKPAVYRVSSLLYNKGAGRFTGEWKPPVQPELLVKADHHRPHTYGEAADTEKEVGYVTISFVKAKEPRDMDDLEAPFKNNL